MTQTETQTENRPSQLYESAAKFFRQEKAGVEMGQKTIAFIDTETTGLNPDEDEIVEIGAIAVMSDGANVRIDRFQTLIDTEKQMHWAAMKKTGLNKDILKEQGIPPNEAFNAFTAWVEKTGPAFFVAHNSEFDEQMIKKNMERRGMGHSMMPQFKCTKLMAKAHLPSLEKHSLEALAEYYEVRNPQAHRAIADAETAAACFFKMARGDIRLLDGDYVKAAAKAAAGAKKPTIQDLAKAKTLVLADGIDLAPVGTENPEGLVLAKYGQKFALEQKTWEKHRNEVPQELIGQMVCYAYYVDKETYDSLYREKANAETAEGGKPKKAAAEGQGDAKPNEPKVKPSIYKTAKAKIMMPAKNADPSLVGKENAEGLTLALYGREFLLKRDAWEKNYKDIAPEELIGQIVCYAYYTDRETYDAMTQGNNPQHERPQDEAQ
ncbi:MAG: 3'-5' exonuclease [Holophagales bacterium]|jgi:DNA polymerase III epsilon subunit-like protein|nr:3'-5' exonuclease [Holophagales bacterium]